MANRRLDRNTVLFHLSVWLSIAVPCQRTADWLMRILFFFTYLPGRRSRFRARGQGWVDDEHQFCSFSLICLAVNCLSVSPTAHGTHIPHPTSHLRCRLPPACRLPTSRESTSSIISSLGFSFRMLRPRPRPRPHPRSSVVGRRSSVVVSVSATNRR